MANYTLGTIKVKKAFTRLAQIPDDIRILFAGREIFKEEWYDGAKKIFKLSTYQEKRRALIQLATENRIPGFMDNGDFGSALRMAHKAYKLSANNDEAVQPLNCIHIVVEEIKSTKAKSMDELISRTAALLDVALDNQIKVPGDVRLWPSVPEILERQTDCLTSQLLSPEQRSVITNANAVINFMSVVCSALRKHPNHNGELLGCGIKLGKHLLQEHIPHESGKTYRNTFKEIITFFMNPLLNQPITARDFVSRPDGDGGHVMFFNGKENQTSVFVNPRHLYIFDGPYKNDDFSDLLTEPCRKSFDTQMQNPNSDSIPRAYWHVQTTMKNPSHFLWKRFKL